MGIQYLPVGGAVRPRARERVYSIRLGRRGVRGMSHRMLQGVSFAPRPKGVKDATRPKGIQYRRGCRGVRGVSHRTRVRCYRSGACDRGYKMRRDRCGGAVMATESVCETVGAGHKPMCARMTVNGG